MSNQNASTSSTSRTLWQIGKKREKSSDPPSKEFLQSGGWSEEFNYNVEEDADSINSPRMPGVLTSPDAKKAAKRGSTAKLNINFTLEQDYVEGELTLIYDRYGAEEDSIFLDGKLLTQIPGAGEGKLQQSQIPLGTVSGGNHTISITTTGDTKDKAHLIDYLKLVETMSPTKKSAPSPKDAGTETAKKPASILEEDPKEHLVRSTGLEDYGFWWKQIGKKDTKEKSKTFRRGRIWT